jgi:hypothetical protein
MNASRLAPLALLLVLLNGCGSDNPAKPVPPSDGLPAGTPAADSPAHLAVRLEATWESQVEGEYAKLLTDDFRFHFSSASDPGLDALYGDNWKRADEIDAITHLFDGFTNADSVALPGASGIDLTLTGLQYQSDFEHPDSTTQYKKLVITQFNATIEVPTAPDPTTYPISSRQELYLVRGDAAVLPAGALADTTHWYVRKWDDLSVSTAFAKGPVINPSQTTSLGHVKAHYHDAPAPVEPPDGLPAGTPQADSPANLAARLEATWESQVATEYAKLLTGDFRFHFSADSDPSLVDQYGDNWGADDETTSISHMFDGFTNTKGMPIPGASRIDMTMYGVSISDDSQHADSSAYFRKMDVVLLECVIEVPIAQFETVTYVISSRHELYLVRGDAAVLPAGAAADPNRWYVRRWDDLSTGYAIKGRVINPTQPKTLGSIKSAYRS